MSGTAAIIRGGSLAYRIKRENADTISGYETGVVAHGRDFEHVADELLGLIRVWACGHYRCGVARIANHPNTVDLTGWRTTERHRTLAIGWS